ncbi:HNH endonuclease signature motif containing protein [Xanthomonas arboricola]|uniref:HNH endonuclease n=1 Tax=Xanthomonas arboricola TaxID=56448 RepID=A0AB73H4P1_9XANT|nr:HNH endonuclease signature motif containing protein [Xanthomonas arboricola]MBB5672588.1 hypothetical protein [Xanthomonas arboricola]
MILNVELVPDTCWYSNVRSNVSAKTWLRISQEVSAAANMRCQICGRVGVRHARECHELWHYDDLRFVQRLDGLLALCPECHAVKHMGRSIATGAGAQALAWLAEINSFSPAEALQTVRSAFAIHRSRSQHRWSLDVSLLTTRYRVTLLPNGQERI